MVITSQCRGLALEAACPWTPSRGCKAFVQDVCVLIDYSSGPHASFSHLWRSHAFAYMHIRVDSCGHAHACRSRTSSKRSTTHQRKGSCSITQSEVPRQRRLTCEHHEWVRAKNTHSPLACN